MQVDHYGTRTKDQWPATMANYGIGDGAFYSKHIRCGDLLALWLLVRQYCYSRLREVKLRNTPAAVPPFVLMAGSGEGLSLRMM